MTIIVPEIPHTVYPGVVKHLMDWATSFCKEHCRIDKLHLLWAMVFPYPGLLDSSCHITRWCNGVVRRWKHSAAWLFQFLWRLFRTLWWAQWFPAEKPCCASKTLNNFTLWHSTGTILKPWSSTWRSIWRSFIIRRMFLFNSTAPNQQRRTWKPRKSGLLWTKSSNDRVSRLGTIFQWLQTIVALMMIKCRSSQMLHNISLTN